MVAHFNGVCKTQRRTQIEMAQAGLSRLLWLLGGGSLVVAAQENGSLSDALRTIAGLIAGGSRGSASDGGLNNKVDHLAQEMRQLMARGGSPSTIVVQGGGGSSTIKGLVLLALPGTAGYLYCRFYGYTISDLKWVSASTFREAYTSLGQKQAELQTKLVAFRSSAEQALESFRAIVERKFGEQQQLTDAVHADVQGVRSELAGVDHRVHRLEGKMDDLKSQLAYTDQGINLLSNVLAERLGSQNSKSITRRSRSCP